MRLIGLVAQWWGFKIWNWKKAGKHKFKNYEQFREWYERISYIYWDIMCNGGKMAFSHRSHLFFLARKSRGNGVWVMSNYLGKSRYYRIIIPRRFPKPFDTSMFPKNPTNEWILNPSWIVSRNGAFIVHCKKALEKLDKQMGLAKGFSDYISDRLSYRIVNEMHTNSCWTVRMFCIYLKPLKEAYNYKI